jgi:hypothetical protein
MSFFRLSPTKPKNFELPTELQSIISLVDESYHVATTMTEKLYKEMDELLEDKEKSIQDLLADWPRVLKDLHELEAVWGSVVKVCEEEKLVSSDHMSVERVSKFKSAVTEHEKVLLHIFWVEIYEKECIAAIYLDKAVTQTKSATFQKKLEHKKATLDILWIDALEKLVESQKCWRKLILTIPYPSHQDIWNKHFKISRNYPDLFSYWSHWWKTAVKCRFDTKLEANSIKDKQQNPQLLRRPSSFFTSFGDSNSSLNSPSTSSLSPSSSNANNRNQLTLLFFEKIKSTLDNLSELKKSEENIWDELIMTSQTIRKLYPTPLLDNSWKLLLQEIEFQKCYTLIETALIKTAFLRSQLNEIAHYPLIRYHKQRLEKRREEQKTPASPKYNFIDFYEKLSVAGANIRMIEQLCELWKQYKKELILEEELCDNAVNIYELLVLEHPELESDFYSLLLPSQYFLLSSMKWKLNYVKQLIDQGKAFLDSNLKSKLTHSNFHPFRHSVSKLEGIDSKSISDRKNKEEDKEIAAVESSQEDDVSRKSEDRDEYEYQENQQLGINAFRQAKEICERLLLKYQSMELKMWKPDTFEVVSLSLEQQKMNGALYDYETIKYDAIPMKIFLEILQSYPEMTTYRGELEEMLFGVPDFIRNKFDDLLEKANNFRQTIVNHLEPFTVQATEEDLLIRTTSSIDI